MPEPAADLRIIVPPQQAAGTYSNALTGWFSAHEITLDFCVTLASDREEDDSPAAVLCLVVSRLKVPVTAAFNMLQGLNGIMTEYEGRYGQIKRVEEDDQS